MSDKVYFLSLLFFLFCFSSCSSKGTPVGQWALGPVENPVSNHQSFSADEWANSLPVGAEFTLVSNGSAYGAGAILQEAALEGGWKDKDIEISWSDTNEKGIVLQSTIRGVYNKKTDKIDAKIFQTFLVGPMSIELNGNTVMTRVLK